MLAALHARGPDDVDVHLDSHAALGVRRLAIVDVAEGRQPMSTADGRFTIAYNGECYAVGALRDSLVARGVEFRTRSDTEVVLYAYAQWGPAAFDRLDGMFALAIWDARRGEMLLARDRFGIKPLYYMPGDDRLLFASTAAALAARDDVDRRIDPNAVELYLSSKFIPAPYSIYRSIRKLPAGFWAQWRGGRLQLQRWWDLPIDAGASSALSRRAALHEVDQRLSDAIRVQSIAERPVGLCLSGGIDSGLLAAHLRGLRVPTFSIGAVEAEFDESPAARAMARRFGLESHVVALPTQPLALLDDVVAALDEPLGDPSCAALMELSRVMSRRVTVALSGTGGDELFGGYRRYVAARLAWLAARIPRLASGPARWLSRRHRDAWERFAGAAKGGPLACYLQLIQPTTAELAGRLRNPEFSRAVDVRFSELAADWFDRPTGRSLLTRLSYVDIKTMLPDGYLAKEDRMMMAHSLEGRFPMLDHRLAEFAFAMPDRFKQQGLRTKRLLRRLAARRGLPAGVVRGRKRGFEVPLSAWLRGPLADRMRDTLLPREAVIKQYCRAEVVNAVVGEHLAGQAEHGRLLWCLLIFESWMRRQVASAETATRSADYRTGVWCRR